MNCNTARLLLEYARPQIPELLGEDAQALEQHVATCADCNARARAERAADERIAMTMRAVPVPGELRQQLLTRLDRERARWYWRSPLRHPRLTGAAAAILLLVLGGGILWANRPLPVIDAETFLESANAQVMASPEQVEQGFEKQGMRTTAPPGFNYGYLSAFDLQELSGKLVPHLLFVRGSQQASVYILSAKQYDIQTSLNQPRASSGIYTIEVRPHPTNPQIAYLIKYTGESLEWFMEPGERRPEA